MDDVIEELLRVYGEQELAIVRGLIESSTLREAAELVVDGPAGEARIVIPHYWAVYYHDGREGFEAQNAAFLVFFADPADDPRLAGGYPVRESDIRRLTRAEFFAGLAENDRRAASGEGPAMFVVRSVGPAGAHPFFDQLAEGAAVRMDQLALAAIDAHVQRAIDEDRGERRTAKVRL